MPLQPSPQTPPDFLEAPCPRVILKSPTELLGSSGPARTTRNLPENPPIKFTPARSTLHLFAGCSQISSLPPSALEVSSCYGAVSQCLSRPKDQQFESLEHAGSSRQNAILSLEGFRP